MFCQNCQSNIYYHKKYIIRYYVYVLNAVKDSTKLRLNCLCMVDLDFCITYLKNTNFNLVTYLTATCTQLTTAHTESITIHAGIPCIFWFIYNNKHLFTKCYIVGCSIQHIFVITTQIEPNICKLVEQKLIYVT